MNNIFISYQREDVADVTGRISDRLRQYYGEEAIITDVDSFPLGLDFRRQIDQAVSQCKVLLAVIGRNWLKARNERGQLGLSDRPDYVRIEIESALQRDIPVIPLLVQGTEMPTEDELPESLRGFSYRNGTPIRPDPDFRHDMDRLIKNLDQHFRAYQEKEGTARQQAEEKKRAEEEAALQQAEAKKRAEEELASQQSEAKKRAEEETARQQAESKKRAEKETAHQQAEEKKKAEEEAALRLAEVKKRVEEVAARQQEEAKEQAKVEKARKKAVKKEIEKRIRGREKRQTEEGAQRTDEEQQKKGDETRQIPESSIQVREEERGTVEEEERISEEKGNEIDREGTDVEQTKSRFVAFLVGWTIYLLVGIFVALLLGVIWLLGTTQDEKQNNPGNDAAIVWEKFDDPNFKIRFDYPKGWYKQAEGTKIVFSSSAAAVGKFSNPTSKDAQDGAQIFVSYFEYVSSDVLAVFHPDRELDEFVQATRANLKEKGFILKPVEKAMVDSTPALKFSYSVQYDANTRLEATSIWSLKDSSYYQVTYSGFNDQFDLYRSVIDRFIATAKFLSSGAVESQKVVKSLSDDETPPADYVPYEKAPEAVRQVQPKYPDVATRAGLEGTVWVKIWVDRQGKPKKAVVQKSDAEIFNRPATEAAMQWIFTPATTKNGPVSVWVSIPFRFKLEGK
jgi:TonB family protein